MHEEITGVPKPLSRRIERCEMGDRDQIDRFDVDLGQSVH